MNDRRFAGVAAVLATLSTVALVVEPIAASAQNAAPAYDRPPYDQNGYDQSDPDRDAGPPPGGPPAESWAGAPPPRQYAPPPQTAGGPDFGGSGHYAPPYQPAYAEQQARYAQWAAQNCASQHNNNATAGAIFGGVAGALMGFSLAGWAARGAWTLFGGTMGAALGSVVGSSTNNDACRNGQAAWAGTAYGPGPVAYAPPVYAAGPAWRPAPTGPWVWTGDHWAHRPYGYGYRRWGSQPEGNAHYRY